MSSLFPFHIPFGMINLLTKDIFIKENSVRTNCVIFCLCVIYQYFVYKKFYAFKMRYGLSIKDVRTRGGGVVQCGHFADKGSSSDADVRTIFRNLWYVRTDKRS